MFCINRNRNTTNVTKIIKFPTVFYLSVKLVCACEWGAVLCAITCVRDEKRLYVMMLKISKRTKGGKV